MHAPMKKRINFRVGKKSAPTPAEASEEGTKTKSRSDEEVETPVSEVVAEALPVADSPSPSPSPSPGLLPAFVLREGSSPLALSEYDRIRAEAPRLLRGRTTFLRSHHLPRHGAAHSSAAAAAAARLVPIPTLEFAYPPKPFSFGGGGNTAAGAASFPFLPVPTLELAYPPRPFFFGGVAAAAAAEEASSSSLSRLPPPIIPTVAELLALGCSVGGPSLAAAEKNGDAEARRQQLLLVAEEAQGKPLLGEKEPLSALAGDFPADNAVIQEKIKMLNHAFASFRRVRRDGNCFYRSFIISYLEQIAESQDEGEVFRIFRHLHHLKEDYISFGEDGDRFEDFFADFCNVVITFVEERPAGISLTQLLQKNLDEYKSDTVLIFLRLITSVDIRMREEHFSPFILCDTNHKSIEEYCENEVLPLGVEAEHMQVVALSNAFCIPIRVVYLGSSSRSGGELNHHDFIPVKHANKFSDLSFLIDGSGSSSSSSSSSSSLVERLPVVVLLYRPGHYDVLYPK